MDDRLTARRGRRFVHKPGLSDLFTTEPPVVVIRVGLPVIEAPIRRGLALSHLSMLALTCEAAANHTRSTAFAVVRMPRLIGISPEIGQ